MTARFVTASVLAGIVTLAAAARAQAQLESSVPELRDARSEDHGRRARRRR